MGVETWVFQFMTEIDWRTSLILNPRWETYRIPTTLNAVNAALSLVKTTSRYKKQHVTCLTLFHFNQETRKCGESPVNFFISPSVEKTYLRGSENKIVFLSNLLIFYHIILTLLLSFVASSSMTGLGYLIIRAFRFHADREADHVGINHYSRTRELLRPAFVRWKNYIYTHLFLKFPLRNNLGFHLFMSFVKSPKFRKVTKFLCKQTLSFQKVR